MILGFSSLTPKDVFFSFLSLFLEGKKTARPVLGRHQVVSILEQYREDYHDPCKETHAFIKNGFGTAAGAVARRAQQTVWLKNLKSVFLERDQ